MGSRLFTALVPPTAVVEALDEFLAPRREADPRLRWTKPEGWHLTTSFMGSVADSDLEGLLDSLRDVAVRTAPFHVRLAGAGAFPNPYAAKALWLGVPVGREALGVLARRARTAAERAGVRVDGTRFTPHLTLARSNRPLEATRWLRVLDAFGGAGWRATSFRLIESHLADRGNRYETLADLDFTAEIDGEPSGDGLA